jgi:hypothetical protein
LSHVGQAELEKEWLAHGGDGKCIVLNRKNGTESTIFWVLGELSPAGWPKGALSAFPIDGIKGRETQITFPAHPKKANS